MEVEEKEVRGEEEKMDKEEERRDGHALDESVRHLLGALDRLEPSLKNREKDLQFLRGLLHSSDFNVLMKTHKKLTSAVADRSSKPDSRNAVTLSHMVLYDLEQSMDNDSQKLFELLNQTHVHSVLLAYDQVANKDYPVQSIAVDEQLKGEQVEIVRIDKKQEPLGATVRQDKAGNILISRVLHGSVADRSKQLHPGDVIHEINGKSLRDKTIDDVADMMQLLSGVVVLKKSSTLRDNHPQRRNQSPTYMRALFSYDPEMDSKQPCQEAGLGFKMRDVLSVVNMEDHYWWQASHVGEERIRVGLIPSTLTREGEWFEKIQQGRKHRGKKVAYSPTQEFMYSGREVLAYEEVVRIAPQIDKPRPIILIAPSASPFEITRMVTEIISRNPFRFVKAIPHTTRPRPHTREAEEGKAFHYVSKATFEAYIRNKGLVEYVKDGGHYYGICSHTIKETRREGKVCLLQVNPKSLKYIRNQELMPYIVHFEPHSEERIRENWVKHGVLNDADVPTLMQACDQLENYRHWFDATLTYNNVAQAIDELQQLVDNLMAKDSWVPATWAR